MISKLLFKLSGNLPCRIINRDGGVPYLERYYIGAIFGITIYLHRFVKTYYERAHDHPWSWSASLILSGSYEELDIIGLDPDNGPLGTIKHRCWFNYIPLNKFHAVVNARSNTWTLFLHGRRIKSWGFIHKGPNGLVYEKAKNADAYKDWSKQALKGKFCERYPM